MIGNKLRRGRRDEDETLAASAAFPIVPGRVHHDATYRRAGTGAFTAPRPFLSLLFPLERSPARLTSPAQLKTQRNLNETSCCQQETAERQVDFDFVRFALLIKTPCVIIQRERIFQLTNPLLEARALSIDGRETLPGRSNLPLFYLE